MREQGNVSDEAASIDFAYPQGVSLSLQHIHQQDAHSQMVLSPAMMLPQSQQPFDVDDDGGGGRYYSVHTPGGFVVPPMVEEPMAYLPFSPTQQPFMSFFPSLLHPQHAIITAAANHSWQQQHNQHLIMTAGPSLNFQPGCDLPQASSAAHHQSPTMMHPGVFSHGYVQLQPLAQQQLMMLQQKLAQHQQQHQLDEQRQQLVQQQQQLMMGRVNPIHTGFVADAVGGWIPVDTAEQLQPQLQLQVTQQQLDQQRQQLVQQQLQLMMGRVNPIHTGFVADAVGGWIPVDTAEQLQLQPQLQLQVTQQQLDQQRQQLVQQQQQLMMGRLNSIHTGFELEQQHQPADHAQGGWIPVDTAEQLQPQLQPQQFPQQASTMHNLPAQHNYASFEVPDVARVQTSSTTHASTNSSQHQTHHQEKLFVHSPYSMPPQFPKSPP